MIRDIKKTDILTVMSLVQQDNAKVKLHNIFNLKAAKVYVNESGKVTGILCGNEDFSKILACAGPDADKLLEFYNLNE